MQDRALDRHFARFRDHSEGAALAAVFDVTSRELLDVACHLVRDPSQAEDLVQTAFLTAIRRKAAFDGRSTVRAWLYGILWREAAKVRRAAARRVDPRRLEAREESDPLDLAAAAEIPRAVALALERVPVRYRAVLDPLLQEGRQPEEIARALQRSPGTVRSQIHRGLERLRRGLPQGLAPAHGLAAISVGGLERVRAEVLQAAGASPSTVAAASMAGPLALGGLVLSKGALVGAAVLAAAVGVWFVVDRSTADAAESAASHAAAIARVFEKGDAASDLPMITSAAPDARTPAPSIPEEPLPSAPDPVEYWLDRFREAPDDWRHGWSVAEEIAKLPPDEALRILRAVWPDLSVPVKEQALKPFVFDSGHVHALPILDLAAKDEAISVQSRAFEYLKAYAFQEFATDYEAYLRWSTANRDRPVAEVLVESAARLANELQSLSPAEMGARVRAFGRLDLRAGGPAKVDLAATLRESGGLRVLETCLQSPDPEVQQAALDWTTPIRPDESWMRAWVLPAVEQPGSVDPAVLDRSFKVLGTKECAWAREPIQAYLTTHALDESSQARSAARALGEMGDPASIPAMIQLVANDTTGRLAYDVGYFGLAKLTGVRWQDSYDGRWWLDWWEKNRMRLPPEVRDVAIR